MIRGLVGLADYVIVDLPGDLSAATRATMRQSDLLVVVADCDPAGLAAGRATLRLLKSSGACSGQVGAVAVNRTVASRSVNVEEIGRQMGCTLLGVVPPAEEACMAAMRLGAPIVLSQSDSLAACALRKIGQKVADLCT
jgi:MinD-like ATPase involved in chromosome partitioning or flagellar assembly